MARDEGWAVGGWGLAMGYWLDNGCCGWSVVGGWLAIYIAG